MVVKSTDRCTGPPESLIYQIWGQGQKIGIPARSPGDSGGHGAVGKAMRS